MLDGLTHEIQVKVSEIVTKESQLVDEAIFGYIQRIANEEGIKIDVKLNRDFIIKSLQNRKENTVKHGKWTKDDLFQIPFCSVCGEAGFGLHAFDFVETNYCPNCGAKMDK